MIKTGTSRRNTSNGGDIIRNGDIVNIHWKNRYGYETWGRSNILNTNCKSKTWNYGKVEDVNMPGGPFEIVIIDTKKAPESNLWDCKGNKQGSTSPIDCAQPKLPEFDITRKL